jgi:hypothetical protein
MYLQSPSARLDHAPTKLGLLIGIAEIDDGECNSRVTPGVLPFE